jgi:AraC-like DNA-binding protein
MAITTSIISKWKTESDRSHIAVWPDGCRDIIFIHTPGSPVKMICTGLDFSMRHVETLPGSLFAGIRFKPGVSFPWDRGNPSGKTSDTDITDFNRSLKQELDRLKNSPDGIHDLILELTDKCAEPSPDWISDHLDLIKSGIPQTAPYKSRERTIRRNFVRHTGAPPKFWRNLQRARTAAFRIVSSQRGLSDIAADLYFSDQAHMTREIRKWFDRTPASLRNDRERVLTMLSSPDAFGSQSAFMKYGSNSGEGLMV